MPRLPGELCLELNIRSADDAALREPQDVLVQVLRDAMSNVVNAQPGTYSRPLHDPNGNRIGVVKFSIPFRRN